MFMTVDVESFKTRFWILHQRESQTSSVVLWMLQHGWSEVWAWSVVANAWSTLADFLRGCSASLP